MKTTINPPRQILIVDDEKIVRDSLGEWLTSSGYDIISAEEGEEAIRLVAVKDVFVALVDFKLPGRYDGLGVLKKIKSLKNIPVIIITAYGSIQNAVEAMKLGASDYVTKPFEPEELELKIESLIKEVEDKLKREDKIDSQKKFAEDAAKNIEQVENFKRVTEEEIAVSEKQEGKKPAERQCVWAKAGVISYRACIKDFDCASCEFAQYLMDKGGEEGGFAAMRMKLLQLPASKRKCRYMLSDDVAYKICPNLYQCASCQYDQYMSDMKQQQQEKLTARIEKMQKRKGIKK